MEMVSSSLPPGPHCWGVTQPPSRADPQGPPPPDPAGAWQVLPPGLLQVLCVQRVPGWGALHRGRAEQYLLCQRLSHVSGRGLWDWRPCPLSWLLAPSPPAWGRVELSAWSTPSHNPPPRGFSPSIFCPAAPCFCLPAALLFMVGTCGLPCPTWPSQPVTSSFLCSCRVFAPKCASCARPILPAQVGTSPGRSPWEQVALVAWGNGGSCCLARSKAWLRSLESQEVQLTHMRPWAPCCP